ncbi:MAG: methylthioribulose 1-phosphate dehydratase [Acidobacteriota bacterium]
MTTALAPEVARNLRDIGADFYARGWVLGTSGNFSAVLSTAPLQLAITASAVSKGALEANDILVVDAAGVPLAPDRARPSAETALHLAIARQRGAGAILHTHSVWSTILSELHGASGGLTIAGFEMLKGLHGVTTHEHVEWVPILDNAQDMPALATRVEACLAAHPAAHGFLLRGHGLYTWGASLAEARRHVEIFEFLLEATGRMRSLADPRAGGDHGNRDHS